MSILKSRLLLALPILLGSFWLLLPATAFADRSMQPRTCSNCSGFGNKSPVYQHQPSPGIRGHRSFGNHQYKNYRPKTYDNFKHSGERHYQRNKPSYKDHRPRFDGYQHRYQPQGHYLRGGVSLGIVAPIIYSGSNNYSVAPRSYAPKSVPRATPLPQTAAQPNIDAWAALSDYQSGLALDGFNYQSRQNPENALPKVGHALATAVSGEYDKAAWAMDLSLADDVSELHYFQADTNLQLVLAELLFNYPDQPFMRSAILYLKQDYRAADSEISEALQQCNDCRSEQNLQALIQRKQR